MKKFTLLALATTSMLLITPTYAAQNTSHSQLTTKKVKAHHANSAIYSMRFGLQATSMANLGTGPTFIFAKEKVAFGGGILFRDHETTLTSFAEWRKKLKHSFIVGLGADYTYSFTRHSVVDDFSTFGPRVSLSIDFDNDIMASIWLNPYAYSDASYDKHNQFMRRGGISLTFYY